MKSVLLLCAVLSQGAVAGAAPDKQPGPKLPELKPTGPDTARAVYPDMCSNGGNGDEQNRDKFVQLMLDNPKSKLAQAKAALYKTLRGDPHDDVFLTEWVQTFHDRDGCGASHNSYSAVLETLTDGNSNHTVARKLVTIDDDDDGGVRKLSLRSIQPISVRDEDENAPR